MGVDLHHLMIFCAFLYTCQSSEDHFFEKSRQNPLCTLLIDSRVCLLFCWVFIMNLILCCIRVQQLKQLYNSRYPLLFEQISMCSKLLIIVHSFTLICATSFFNFFFTFPRIECFLACNIKILYLRKYHLENTLSFFDGLKKVLHICLINLIYLCSWVMVA